MSAGFQVSLPALDELSARVAIAGSDVRSTLGSVELNACLVTDSPRLSAALDGFSQFWQGAITQSSASIDTTAIQMSQAAIAYGTVDSTVMVDPTLTKAFVQETLDGNSAEAGLLIAPLLPGAGTPQPASPIPLPTGGGK